MKDKEPIVLTGRTFVTGALADTFPSRELVQRNAKVGDMKLWCHLKPGARVWSGVFRSAVFDGKKWHTFRLNVVADSDVRYDTLDERPAKARRCFDAIAQLKGQIARVRQDGTWGCTFTMKAPAAAAPAKTPAPAPAQTTTPVAAQTTPAPVPVKTATPAPALTATPAPAQAARVSQTPPTAAHTRATQPRRRRKKQPDPNQLTLF